MQSVAINKSSSPSCARSAGRSLERGEKAVGMEARSLRRCGQAGLVPSRTCHQGAFWHPSQLWPQTDSCSYGRLHCIGKRRKDDDFLVACIGWMLALVGNDFAQCSQFGIRAASTCLWLHKELLGDCDPRSVARQRSRSASVSSTLTLRPTRAFKGRVINVPTSAMSTSSISGSWASIRARLPHPSVAAER